jgi:pyruvate formate lyase activating enzyme
MEITKTKSGKIFNIQRFSIYDGPGARTVVFFSGCNLNCVWCHNPESVSTKQQIKFNADSCILCGNCFDICETKAHMINNGLHTLERGKCEACLKCAVECYAEALVPVCREMTVAEVENSILTDDLYFKQSGGGVTFSGGEPMLQLGFLREILKVCKSHDIHTAVDTAGAVDFEAFEKILPYCDLFLYDVKAYNGDIHKKLTGMPSEPILENLMKLSKIPDITLCIRIPVIPGANTNEMADIAKFLGTMKINKCELLPYHRLGEGKYKSLGIENANAFDEPDDNLMDEIKKLFIRKGINV